MLKHSRDFNLTRECVLGTRLDPHTPAYDVQQACGTGLEATILVANKIALGQVDSGIAGGFDTTSDAPIAVNEDLRQVLLEINRAKGNAARLKALTKLRPQQIVPQIPRNAEPRTGLSMGEHAAIMAKEWGVTREEQDELTVASHRNLAAAYDTRLPRRPRHPVPRPRARPEPASGLERRETGQAEARVRRGAGHDDRRQLDPVVRRRLRGAAGERGLGGGAQRGGPGVRRSTPRPPPSTTFTRARGS